MVIDYFIYLKFKKKKKSMFKQSKKAFFGQINLTEMNYKSYLFFKNTHC